MGKNFNDYFEITTSDASGKRVQLDGVKFGEAVRQYHTKLAELKHAEDDEIIALCKEYQDVRAEHQADFDSEQAIITQRDKDFDTIWGEQFTVCVKETQQMEKSLKKMARNGTPFIDRKKFAEEQGDAITKKYRDMLTAQSKSVAENKMAVTDFNAKWGKHPEFAEYDRKRKAIERKYKQLRRSLREPQLRDFPMS